MIVFKRTNTLFFQVISWYFLVGSVAGQSFSLPKTPLAQRTIGEGGQDDLFSVTVNWRGDIAAIGNAAKGKEGGQDLSFVAFDAQLNPLVQRHIGRRGDDGAGQIAILPDGRYLLAGYSTKPSGNQKIKAPYHGKQDGWLLVLDEKGETQREFLFGTGGDDRFVAVATSANGNIHLAGQTGDEAWVLCLSPAFEVLWERRVRYRHLPTRVAAAALTPAGTFFLVGGIEELGRKHLWVAGFSANGETLLENIYPSSQAEFGTAIIALDAATLAVVGTIKDPNQRENGFLGILGNTGVMRHYETLGGREYDQVNAVIRLHDGRLLAAGGSASFERGSRRVSAWLTLLASSGLALQSEYYGSKLDDEALALAEHPDGRLIAVGTTARQILKLRQGWLFQLSGRSNKFAPPETLRPILNPAPHLANGLLPRQGRAYIPFSMENVGLEGQANIRATVKLRSNTERLLRLPANRSVLLPPIPAQKRFDWGLPLQFAEDAPTGVYPVDIQFFQGDRPIGEPLTIAVAIGENALPKLVLTAAPPDSALRLGKEGLVSVEVRNIGSQTARNLTLSAIAPNGVRLPASVLLGNLPPGGSKQYHLPITPENVPLGKQTLKLDLRVVDDSLLYPQTTALLLDIAAPPKNAQIGNGYTVAVWVYPNPDNFERDYLVWPQEEITVQVKIVSNQTITRQQFCLEINGHPCQTGVKFDEVQIKGDRNSKTFSQPIRLRHGENLLKATVQTPNGPVNSDPLKIFYAPSKPNLHILSVGIPSADLKYTVKDARDFAQALAAPQNKAFGKIFVDTLLTEERTTKTEILKALRRLQYRYGDLQILPKDLLVIFVSGHGLGAYDGTFRLAASDYDAPFVQETSLDFEQEIVNYLQSLPCQKLFFVDACHSGTVFGAGISSIAAKRTNLNMLLSCQPKEYSYEDDAWKNGAFTHALVRGFNAFSQQNTPLDGNFDNKLDVLELFKYVEQAVPQLVEKKRPKTNTTQRPNFFVAESGKAVVLFE